jgi:hypothetical protein
MLILFGIVASKIELNANLAVNKIYSVRSF